MKEETLIIAIIILRVARRANLSRPENQALKG